MSTHTPGPWYIEEISNRDWQINSDSRDWCLLEITPAIYGESDSLSDEDKANARLIAAAPDLLHEGKTLIKALKTMAINPIHYAALELSIANAEGKS